MSQGLSVQAQAALAQRLQAGGVNGMNGGMLQLCRAASTTSFLGRLLHAFRILCVTHSYLLAHAAGLDAIQEQQPYKGLSPGMLQALSQLGTLFCPSMSPCPAAAECDVLTYHCQPAFIVCIKALQAHAHIARLLLKSK